MTERHVPLQQEPGLAALRRREASFGTSRTDLPITPEPEDDDPVPSVGLNNDAQGGELFKDSGFGVSSVPSVGLRDRIARALHTRSVSENPILHPSWDEMPTAELNGWRGWADACLSVLHEAGTQGDGGLVLSLAVSLMTATTEAQEGIKPSDEALRHRDALVQRARAAGEGQRQHREMFDTFAPTEPTIDDLQRSPAEAGTQDEGQEIKGKRSDLAALLGGAEVMLGSRAQVAGGALAVANGLVRPEARHDIVDRPSMVAAQPEAGTQEDEA